MSLSRSQFKLSLLINKEVKMIRELARKNVNHPSVFNSSFFDDIFGGISDLEPLFLDKGSNVPCDIVAIKNEQGEIVQHEFTYALAGYDKDNVNIEVDDNRLTISISKSEEKTEEDPNKTYIHRGLTRRSQQWSYILDNKVDTDNIQAKMEDGLLKVVVPIHSEKLTKKIQIK